MKPVRQREARFAGICGILALVLGLGNVICGSILLGFEIKNGDGLWSGLGLLLAGSLGVIIWWTKFRPAMLLFLVMCSVLVIALVIQIAVAVIGFIFWRHFIQTSDNCYLFHGACRCTTSDGKKLPIPLNSCDLIKIFDDVYLALILFSILSFLVTTAGSFIGCLSTCFEDIKEPKRQLTVLTQPTDLEQDPVYQSPESESPDPERKAKEAEATGNEAKENETKGNESKEDEEMKDEAKGDEVKENEVKESERNENEMTENYYDEIVVEKTEEVPAKEVTIKDS